MQHGYHPHHHAAYGGGSSASPSSVAGGSGINFASAGTFSIPTSHSRPSSPPGGGGGGQRSPLNPNGGSARQQQAAASSSSNSAVGLGGIEGDAAILAGLRSAGGGSSSSPFASPRNGSISGSSGGAQGGGGVVVAHGLMQAQAQAQARAQQQQQQQQQQHASSTFAFQRPSGVSRMESSSLLSANGSTAAGGDDDDDDDDGDEEESDEDGDEDDDDEDESEDDSGDRARATGSAASSQHGTNAPVTGQKRKVPSVGVGPGNSGKPIPLDENGNPKKRPKLKRGSRACTVCRRLKMKCIGADIASGGKCKRCRTGGHECVFEASNRGKKNKGVKRSKPNNGNGTTSQSKKLTQIEQTLDTVLRSIHDPGQEGLASAMMDVSPIAPMPSSGPRTLGAPLASLVHLRDGGPSPVADPVAHRATLMSAGSPQSHNQGIASLADSPQQSSMPRSEAGSLSDRRGVSPHVPQRPPSPRLHSLPENSLNPLGLLAEASLQNSQRKRSMNMSAASSTADSNREELRRIRDKFFKQSSQRKGKGKGRAAADDGTAIVDDNDDQVQPPRLGVGDEHYFKPGPMSILPLRRVFIERELTPEMLKFTSAEEVNELFEIYFDRINRHLPLLNREMHTPSAVCARSPFLLTTICAIAARFYTKKPELHTKLNASCKKLIWSVAAKGYKSVEVVQAYLMLANYCMGPEERYEQDRTWMLLGLALRNATDLNLHRKSQLTYSDTEEGTARDREIMNRERCWLLCFVFDRSLSAQMGKPYTIREDAVLRTCLSETWPHNRFSSFTDQPVQAYAIMQQIMSRALDTLHASARGPTGLMAGCDYPLILHSIQEQLDTWHEMWSPNAERTHPADSRLINEHYKATARFFYNYNSLVINSFGLQHALENSPTDLPFYFVRVYQSAMAVLDVTSNVYAKHGQLPYVTDGMFVMISYAVLSLLKLVRPEFKHLHRDQTSILARVASVTEDLSQAAADPYHTPALYAVLLKSLIQAKHEELAPPPETDQKPAVNGAIDPTSLRSTVSGYPGPSGISYSASFQNATHPASSEDAMFWDWTMAATLRDGGGKSFGLNEKQGGNGAAPTLAQNAVSAPVSTWPTPMASGMAYSPQTSTAAGAGESSQQHPPSATNTITVMGPPATPVEHHATISSATGALPSGQAQMEDYGGFLGIEDFGQWDSSLLMPGFGGFGQLELSGGLVHGLWGSGIISPNVNMTPQHSNHPSPRGTGGHNTPRHAHLHPVHAQARPMGPPPGSTPVPPQQLDQALAQAKQQQQPQ